MTDILPVDYEKINFYTNKNPPYGGFLKNN